MDAAARSSSPRSGCLGETGRRRVAARPERQPDHRVRHGVEADPRRLGLGDERADDVVRRPEGDAAPDERVGHGRRGRVALAGRRGHPGGVDRQRADQPGHDPERRLEHGDRVEQRRLVLLEVALVGERQALEQGQRCRSAPR